MMTATWCLLAVLLILNVLAYLHARSMTHFAAGGVRTHRPEMLSLRQKAKVLITGITLPRPCNLVTPDSIGLAFETHRFRSDGGPELEGWHLPHTDATALVLLFHGYTSCKAELLPEAKALHELGYASLLIDFRGSGGSAGAATTIGVSEADDVAAAFAYAGRTWPGLTVVLFGQSMGGTAVLRAVIVHGLEPPAVILACPFDRLVTTVGNRFGSMGLPAFPAAGLLVFWGGVQHGFNGFRHNPVDYAKRVRCPVLLLQGDLDPRVTPAQARAIFANLAGEKYFELLLGVGHENHATSNPEQWKKAVQQFLGTLKR